MRNVTILRKFGPVLPCVQSHRVYLLSFPACAIILPRVLSSEFGDLFANTCEHTVCIHKSTSANVRDISTRIRYVTVIRLRPCCARCGYLARYAKVSASSLLLFRIMSVPVTFLPSLRVTKLQRCMLTRKRNVSCDNDYK